MTVESNYVIAIAVLSDWLKRLAPVFQPMRSKTKTNRTTYASLGAVTLDVLPMGNLGLTAWVGFTLGYVRLPVCGYTLVNYPRGW